MMRSLCVVGGGILLAPESPCLNSDYVRWSIGRQIGTGKTALMREFASRMNAAAPEKGRRVAAAVVPVRDLDQDADAAACAIAENTPLALEEAPPLPQRMLDIWRGALAWPKDRLEADVLREALHLPRNGSPDSCCGRCPDAFGGTGSPSGWRNPKPQAAAHLHETVLSRLLRGLRNRARPKLVQINAAQWLRHRNGLRKSASATSQQIPRQMFISEIISMKSMG